LIEHPWPDNVRELRNSAERMVLSGRSTFRRADVERILHRGAPGATALDLTLRGAEKRAIERALALHDGNRTHAARTLGIGRRTLQMKIREFGLEAGEAQG
jgi:DNA-binding NtrC family response regulator